MKKYRTQDREAGNVIDEFSTYEEAINAISKYEEADKNDGTFTPDFYEVKEVEKTELNEEWAKAKGLESDGEERPSWEGMIDGVNVSIIQGDVQGWHCSTVNIGWYGTHSAVIQCWVDSEEELQRMIDFVKTTMNR